MELYHWYGSVKWRLSRVMEAGKKVESAKVSPLQLAGGRVNVCPALDLIG